MTEQLRYAGERTYREPQVVSLSKLRSAWHSWRISRAVINLAPGVYASKNGIHTARVDRDVRGTHVEVWRECDTNVYDEWEQKVDVTVFADDTLGRRVNATIDDFLPDKGLRSLNCGETEGAATDPRVPREVLYALRHIPSAEPLV